MTESLTVWAPSFRVGGGVQMFSYEVAKALNVFHPALLARNAVTPSEIGDRCPNQWLPLLSLRFPFFLFRHSLGARTKLVVSTHLNFGPVALFIRKLQGAKYILVAHGADVDDDLSGSQIVALREADQIVAVSEHTRQRLLKIPGIRPERIVRIPNTVDDEKFTLGSRDPALLARYKIPTDRQIILTVGRLWANEGHKGYDQIIRGLPRILREIPNAHYMLIGKGDDTPRIGDLIREHGVGDRVTLTGYVSDDELAAHYRLADVFAMPSTNEGFGIVYLEAMACGVPVLAGNRDGSVDALAEGELGVLIDPRSVSEIETGLIQLLRKQGSEWWFNPPELRRRMLAKFHRSLFRDQWQTLVKSYLPAQAAGQESSHVAASAERFENASL